MTTLQMAPNISEQMRLFLGALDKKSQFGAPRLLPQFELALSKQDATAAYTVAGYLYGMNLDHLRYQQEFREAFDFSAILPGMIELAEFAANAPDTNPDRLSLAGAIFIQDWRQHKIKPTILAGEWGYQTGVVIAKDHAKALRYFERGAAMGSADCSDNVQIMRGIIADDQRITTTQMVAVLAAG